MLNMTLSDCGYYIKLIVIILAVVEGLHLGTFYLKNSAYFGKFIVKGTARPTENYTLGGKQNNDSNEGLLGGFNMTSRNYKVRENDKIILYWNSLFERRDWIVGFGLEPFRTCQVSNCYTTNDQNYYNQSEAVLFHMRTTGYELRNLPKWRISDQYWVFHLDESPANSQSGTNLEPYNGMFNLTMTYRQDSDIVTYPHYFVKRKSGKEVGNLAGRRPGSVAWVASNCWSADAIFGRQEYINELSKYIRVNRYGRCTGHKPCGPTCFPLASQHNKFYFAAENSLCKDYITEKPWNALEHNMIPIVYGLANYSKYLLPNSFIDVRDFPSPVHLVRYLMTIDKNDTLYNQFFQWKVNYTIKHDHHLRFCKLCQFLHNRKGPKKKVHKIDTFWSQLKDCLTPHEFHRSVIFGKIQ